MVRPSVGRDRAEAADHAEQAVRLRPRYLAAHKNLGVIRHEQGDLDAAARHFRIALEIDPEDRDARRELKQLGRD